MSATAHSKNNDKKAKNNRKGSGQRSQETRPSIPAESTLQPGPYYDEHFPPFGNPSSSQTSRNNHPHSTVYLIVFCFELNLFISFDIRMCLRPP